MPRCRSSLPRGRLGTSPTNSRPGRILHSRHRPEAGTAGANACRSGAPRRPGRARAGGRTTWRTGGRVRGLIPGTRARRRAIPGRAQRASAAPRHLRRSTAVAPPRPSVPGVGGQQVPEAAAAWPLALPDTVAPREQAGTMALPQAAPALIREPALDPELERARRPALLLARTFFGSRLRRPADARCPPLAAPLGRVPRHHSGIL